MALTYQQLLVAVPLILRAGNVATARDVSLVPLVLVGCVYLAMTAVLTALLRVVEKRSNVWK